MDKLTELGTARGHAKRKVEQAKRELAEAETEFFRADVAYWSYVGESSDEWQMR